MLFGAIFGTTIKNGIENLLQGKAKEFEIKAQTLAYAWISGAVALRGITQAGIG
jgi:hypothetical protein